MIEENKENCNFQQTYNVFGLDDKPCCYLYHKYCEEINNCYFKRCKRLEQENERLKEKLQTYGATGICEVCTEKANIQADTYRKALEEIREVAKVNAITTCWSVLNFCDECKEDCEDQSPFIKLKEIVDKINEVLNDN